MSFIILNFISMPIAARQELITRRTQLLSKADLFLQLIVALRQECYLYASILRDEIQRRCFTSEELSALRSSSFYPMLNGILG